MEQKDRTWSAEELSKVAYWQKHIIWIAMTQLALLFLSAAFISASRSGMGNEGTSAAVGSALLFAGFAVLVFAVIGSYKLASALKRSPAIVYPILMIIHPTVLLIGLFILSHMSTSTLQSNGVKVGIMGADQADIDRLALSAEI